LGVSQIMAGVGENGGNKGGDQLENEENDDGQGGIAIASFASDDEDEFLELWEAFFNQSEKDLEDVDVLQVLGDFFKEFFQSGQDDESVDSHYDLDGVEFFEFAESGKEKALAGVG
jgi:hypothetical protein